jgi:ATP-dependent RNA helicase DDX52/ROK1
MDAIFSSLSTGAKFNKKRNATTLELFSKAAAAEPKTVSKRKINLFEIEDSDADDSDGDDRTKEEDSDDDASSQTLTSTAKKAKKTNLNSEDEINAFKNRLQIKAVGQDVPNPAATFNDMMIFGDLKSIILANIEESAWKEPTPIQMQAIPVMLKGRDILASAPTGSGKTAAFVIPVLSRLEAPKKTGVRGLLLAPTKELAEQIHREAVRLCAGRRIKINLLKKVTAAAAAARKDFLSGVDLLVSTPLRLLALIRSGEIDLSNIEIVVLDEADKLFELDAPGGRRQEQDNDNEDDEEEESEQTGSSFLRQIDEILSKCPDKGVQRGLFSATIGPFVKELASSFLNNPVTVSIGIENAGANTIDQKLIFVGREDGKLLAIRQLIQQGLRPPVLLFMQSKERAKDLYRELVYDGINVDVIHAERTQQQREDIIRRFRIGDIWVLICTDLMARGVDFKGVQMVINYDLPQSAVAYIHRIGRTGRAGKRGTAVTFFTEEDMPRLRPIANVIKISGCVVPDWMLSIKQVRFICCVNASYFCCIIVVMKSFAEL